MQSQNLNSENSEFINTMVKAGAGAGKTYGLIHKIVDLVGEYQHKNPGTLPRFVVTTFTRKATQEVRERLLSKALELRKKDPAFGELFLKFLKSSGHLMVSTIHGVLNQFLRQHGSSIGLDPDFKVVAEAESLLTTILHELLTNDPEVMDMVKKFGWRRLKIFLLEHHCASILNPNIKPLPAPIFIAHWKGLFESIRQNVAELKPQIETMLTKSKSEALRKFGASLSELQNLLSRKDDEVWITLEQIKFVYQAMPKSLGAMTNWDDSAKELRKQITENLKELTEDPWTDQKRFEVHIQDQDTLANLGHRFSQIWLKRKIEMAELELEDLELLSLYILRTFPEQTKAFSETWNYWFIDEYQDTSPIQVEILNHLIGACPHYVVGDPQQSIYFFRGARSKVFHEKLSRFAEGGAKIEVKKINRRSLTPTLCLINDLMDTVNPHQFTAMDSLEERKTDALLVGHFYLVPEDETLHLTGIVSVLKNLLESGIQPNSIALLCRENAELQKLFNELQAAGLPAQISSQGRFLADRQVRDALALWHFLVNPFNDTNLIEVLRTTAFKVSDDLLLETAQRSTFPLWNEFRHLNEPSIQKLLMGLEKLNTLGHIEAWQDLILNSSMFSECSQSDPSGRREGNLWKLITHINEQSRQGMLNYSDPMEMALQTDSNNENEARSIRESNQIQLMTIHDSKGLDFDHVFLPILNHTRKKDGAEFWTTDLENQHWTTSMIDPNTRETGSSYHAQSVADEVHNLLSEESERLFYVAVTRTRKGLYFFPPNESQQVSASGWARHLQDFLARGVGQFMSEQGTYEFVIKDIESVSQSNLATTTNIINYPEPKVLTVKPDTKIESKSITALLKEDATLSSAGAPKNKIEVTFIERGIKTHRQFESYCSSKGTSEIPEEIKSFVETSKIPLQDLLSSGFPEWTFQVQTPTAIVEGQIDLWGRDRNGQVWIVDYKTGSADFQEKAFSQMRLYAWALRKTKQVHPNEIVQLAVCYPLSNQIFMREISPDELNQVKL